MLILYPATLLNLCSRKFLVESCECSTVEYHVVCQEWKFDFFLNHLDAFCFFLLSDAVARTSSTLLKSNYESGHPCLVPDYRGKVLSFSLLRMILTVGPFCMAFMMLRYVSVIPTLWRVFIKDGCWKKKEWMLYFVKWFFCIYWEDHMALTFLLLMWYIMLIDVWISNHPCRPRMNSTWSWCRSLFMYCWIQFSCIWLTIFASMFIRDTVHFNGVFVWFHDQGNAGRVEWVLKISFNFYFLEQFKKNRYYLIFNCLVEFPWEPIWPWTFVCWETG